MTDKTVAQRRLAYAVLDQIEDHPETWNQRAWRCRTGMCFAGWAVQLSGGKWLEDHAEDFGNPELVVGNAEDDTDHLRTDWWGGAFHAGDDPAHYVITARHRAMRVLGLSYEAADQIFDGENTMSLLREHVQRFFGDRPDDREFDE